jgi:hypothetical protein
MNRLLSPYIRHACRLALTLSSVLAFGLLFGGSPGLAAEGGGQSAGEPPAVVSESVSNVTEHDATLEAQINTDGKYTGYEFQIDTNSSFNFTHAVCPFTIPGQLECALGVDGEPLPPGLVEPKPEYIQAGSGEQSVSLDLASIGATLQPDTTYYFQVIVSHGPDGPGSEDHIQTFATPGPQPATDSPPSTSQDPSTVPPMTPISTDPPKSKPLTRSQKLARALRACERNPKKRRVPCRKRAEKRYAAMTKKTGGKTR